MVALRLIGENDSINVIGDIEDPDFRLGKASDGQDIDLGAPSPDQELIEYEVLDGGSVGTDDRWTNRTPRFPLLVSGATPTDRTKNVNRVLRIVGAAGGFTIEWVPDNGLPIYIRSARAAFSRRNRVLRRWVPLDLTSVAEPFGRSDVAETVDTISAIVVLDALDNGTGLTGATYQTGTKYTGTGAAQVALARQTVGGAYRYVTSAPVARTFGSAQNLTGQTSVGLRWRWTPPPMNNDWQVTLALTLTDGTHSATVKTTLSIFGGSVRWYRPLFRLADFTGVNLAAVTAWSLTVTTGVNFKGGNPTPGSTSNAYADELAAYPASVASITTGSGDVQTVPGVKGTARTPASLVVQRAGGGTFSNALVHRPPVEQDPDLAIIADILSDTVTIPPENGRFDGTYAVVALLTGGGTDTAVAALTITQKSADGSLTYGQAVVETIWPAALWTANAGRIRTIGFVTLPLEKVPDETPCQYVLDIDLDAGPNNCYGIALLDTRGQTVQVTNLPTDTAALYIDEPEPGKAIGQVYYSASDRTAGRNVLALSQNVDAPPPVIDGGPLRFDPGDNRLLLAHPNATLACAFTYFPRWLDERDE